MRTISPYLIAGVLLLVGLMPAAARADDDAKPATYWVFLVTGKSAADVPREEIRAKQRAHLENFSRLARQSLLLAAGPMSDPNKTLRGIVVVQAETKEKIDTYFAPDPYVSEGFMKVETHRIVEMEGRITVQLEATELEESRIVVWTRKAGDGELRPVSADLLERHAEYWKQHKAAGRLGLRCRFADADARFGIALLRQADDEQVQRWVAEDPLVAAQAVTSQVMPQFMAKGTVEFGTSK